MSFLTEEWRAQLTIGHAELGACATGEQITQRLRGLESVSAALNVVGYITFLLRVLARLTSPLFAVPPFVGGGRHCASEHSGGQQLANYRRFFSTSGRHSTA